MFCRVQSADFPVALHRLHFTADFRIEVTPETSGSRVGPEVMSRLAAQHMGAPETNAGAARRAFTAATEMFSAPAICFIWRL